MTDRMRSRWLLVVDESVSSEDVSSFCCSRIASFFVLSMLELLVDCRSGFTRAWIKGRSGDSSAKGMFSPSVSGRLMGCWRWDILLTTESRGLESGPWVDVVGSPCGLSSLSDESTDEFLSDRSLLSNIAVTVAVRDDKPATNQIAVSDRQEMTEMREINGGKLRTRKQNHKTLSKRNTRERKHAKRKSQGFLRVETSLTENQDWKR